jgi:hypothetical protein
MTGNSPDDELDSAQLERLMEDVSRLPRDIPPSRDAWPAIRQRIEAQRVRPINGAAPAPRRRISPWWIGVAATLVVAAGTMFTMTRRAKPSEAPLAAVANPRLESVLAEYQQASRELEADVSQRTAGLSPATREVVRRSLATIDTAIADLRSALSANPRDAAAAQSLSIVYERKLDFLKRVRSLPGTGM